MNRIKVIAFDLDDTLWEVTPVLLRAEATLNQWLGEKVESLRYSVEEMRGLRHEVLAADPSLAGKVTELRRRLIEEAMLRSGIAATDAVRLSEDAMEVFLHARNQIELFDGALEVIQDLSRAYVLGVLSNGNADIRRLGLSRYFHFAYSAEDVGAPKPHANLFQAALDKTGTSPAEMVYVGDDPFLDVDAANRLGIRTVRVKREGDTRLGETEADQTVSHVRDLPAAIDKLKATV